MDLITERLKLKEVFPEIANNVARRYKIKADELEFVRKGFVPSKTDFEEGERAAISYISTGIKDRDNEIMKPEGAMLDDYRKNPVVLWCHNYQSLPIGKNIWIKKDKKGLIAKTAYANTEEADKIYNYRKDGFPLAESVGFIPIEWDKPDEDDADAPSRIYTKWILLEYSDVPVPSNPEALGIAISKGLVTKPEVTEYDSGKELLIELKKKTPEEMAEYFSVKYAELQVENINLKEGRVLSTKNRKLIDDCIKQMEEAIIALKELMEATEPPEKEPPKPTREGRDEKPETPKPEIEITSEDIQKALAKQRVELMKKLELLITDKLNKALGRV